MRAFLNMVFTNVGQTGIFWLALKCDAWALNGMKANVFPITWITFFQIDPKCPPQRFGFEQKKGKRRPFWGGKESSCQLYETVGVHSAKKCLFPTYGMSSHFPPLKNDTLYIDSNFGTKVSILMEKPILYLFPMRYWVLH